MSIVKLRASLLEHLQAYAFDEKVSIIQTKKEAKREKVKKGMLFFKWHKLLTYFPSWKTFCITILNSKYSPKVK